MIELPDDAALSMRENGPNYADVLWLRIEFLRKAAMADDGEPLATVDYCERVITPEDCAMLAAVVNKASEDIIAELGAKAARLIRERSVTN